MTERVLGIDVGGANLKMAVWSDQTATAVSRNFAMWKQPFQLAQATHELIHELNSTSPQGAVIHRLAVTMTGELADCFATRREGVAQILDQLQQVITPEQISVYAVDGQWLSIEKANEDPWRVAASNWHALATWLANWPATQPYCDQALLVDIGSTTVDVIPIIDRGVATPARTDRQRLERRQLIYTGLRRTPICAILPKLTLNNRPIPVMAELFATVDDAYLALELIEPDIDDRDTADGRPRTVDYARARLARMIGEDSETLQPHQINQLAEQVVEAQALQVADAIQWNSEQYFSGQETAKLIFSGHGIPLHQRVLRHLNSSSMTINKPTMQQSWLDASWITLTDYVPAAVSRGAPAAAVAWLYAFQHGKP
ncbi:MAG: hypothetical protein IT423_10565 [Pirellulaceae bacterium]|nr:hypothetical protein [Pirellulaceae bacterium]